MRAFVVCSLCVRKRIKLECMKAAVFNSCGLGAFVVCFVRVRKRKICCISRGASILMEEVAGRMLRAFGSNEWLWSG